MSANNSSVLKNLIQDSIASLEDTRVSSLTVSRIDGDKNKSDIKVYIFFENFDEIEVLKRLKKATRSIMNNAFIASGWVRFPKLAFFIDHNFQKQQRIEELFEKIKTKDK